MVPLSPHSINIFSRKMRGRTRRRDSAGSSGADSACFAYSARTRPHVRGTFPLAGATAVRNFIALPLPTTVAKPPRLVEATPIFCSLASCATGRLQLHCHSGHHLGSRRHRLAYQRHAAKSMASARVRAILATSQQASSTNTALLNSTAATATSTQIAMDDFDDDLAAGL